MVRQVERCRAFIPIPDEDEGLIRCGAVAQEQCGKCSDWFCADESSPHLLVDVRCGGKFCEKCLQEHRLRRECETPLLDGPQPIVDALEITEEDVESIL